MSYLLIESCLGGVFQLRESDWITRTRQIVVDDNHLESGYSAFSTSLRPGNAVLACCWPRLHEKLTTMNAKGAR